MKDSLHVEDNVAVAAAAGLVELRVPAAGVLLTNQSECWGHVTRGWPIPAHLRDYRAAADQQGRQVPPLLHRAQAGHRHRVAAL